MTDTAATVGDWVATIAGRAGVSTDEVREVLERHGIEPQASLPRRRRLCLTNLHLKGMKRGTDDDRPIDFHWGPLSSGLWAVLSEDNFRGKSSLLNIAQAALRGSFSTEVKPDVWGWLSLVQLDFRVDATSYRITLEKAAGEKDPRLAQATLARLDGDEWFRIRTGPADKGFEDAVADNMMEEFGFAKFHAFNKDQGSHTHGWNSIAASMFVNGPGKAVFAEVHHDGVSLRLLQLFMGLPWVTTYTAATTALKKVTADREPDKAAAPGADRLSARLAGLEAELVEVRKATDRRIDRVDLRRRLVAADVRLVALQTRVSEGRDAEAALTRQVSMASSSLASSRGMLQQLLDEKAAGLVFRTLRPVCCPSCDAGLDARAFVAAESSGSCALCGTEHVDGSDEDIRIEDLKADVADAEATLASLRAQAEATSRRQRSTETARDGVRHEIDEISDELASTEEANAEIKVRTLEAQVSQLREILAEAPVADPVATGIGDAEILRRVVKATKELYDDLQRDLLGEVSRELTDLCRRFGMKNVERMEWSANNVLRIRQGDADTNFSSLAAGEKLRVRIAAALAVIEVARRRHFGRHPGLLVLDSPAAQEMSPEHFAALMLSVREVVSQADDVQVIIGAVARPELLDVVEGSRTLHPGDDRFLF